MKLNYLIRSALLCALTCVATAFIKVPLAVTGYVHLGDVFVFSACAFLPLPYAVVTAGLGSALADLISGYAFYAPVTLISKCLTALIFALFFSRGKKGFAVLGAVLAAIAMTSVYFLYELILFGAEVAAVNVPFNLLQGGVCAAIALPAAVSLKRYLNCDFRIKTDKKGSKKARGHRF